MTRGWLASDAFHAPMVCSLLNQSNFQGNREGLTVGMCGKPTDSAGGPKDAPDDGAAKVD